MTTFDMAGPNLTKKHITKLEKVLKTKLPAEYTEFLLRNNGGEPVNTVFSIGSPSNTDVIGVFYPVRDDPYPNLAAVHRNFSFRIPAGTLPIANDVFGNQILIRTDGQDKGTILFWDHETEKTTELSPSLDEFLASLQPEEEDEEDEIQTPKKAPRAKQPRKRQAAKPTTKRKPTSRRK